jgi:hypothetical protein
MLFFCLADMADAPPAGERGGFDRGFGGRGRGRGDRGDRGRGRGRGRGRKDDGEEKWVPVTKLGRLVQQVLRPGVSRRGWAAISSLFGAGAKEWSCLSYAAELTVQQSGGI